MDLRQQKYKKNRMMGMNIVNAARAAGYSESYSDKKSFKIERQVKVGLADMFERAGLTDKKIIEYGIAGLNATKHISCNVIAPNGDMMSDAHGTTKDFIEVEDWPTRHKFFETILKLKGHLKPNIESNFTKNEFKITVIYPEGENQFANRIEAIPSGISSSNG